MNVSARPNSTGNARDGYTITLTVPVNPDYESTGGSGAGTDGAPSGAPPGGPPPSRP